MSAINEDEDDDVKNQLLLKAKKMKNLVQKK
jgi:hypothetical protein